MKLSTPRRTLLVCALSLLLVVNFLVEAQTNTTDNNTTAETIPTTTTTTTTMTTTTTKRSPVVDTNTNTLFCTCDLTINYCDINCCCDDDCTIDDQLIFTGCLETENAIAAEQYCLSENILFLTNTDLSTSRTNGQICVSSDTTANQDFLQIPQLATDADTYSQYDISEYSSSSYQSAIIAASSFALYNASATSYKNSDYLVTVSVASSVTGALQVPSAQPATSTCLDRTPALFLEDRSAECVRHMTDRWDTACLGQAELSADFYRRFRVIAAPYQAANQQIVETSLVDVRTLDAVALPLYDVATGICYNVVTEVSYIVYHSAGIIDSITVSFTAINVTNTTASLTQTYSIKYREDNSSIADNQQSKSGNPGYIVGYPVVAGWRTSADSIELNSDRSKLLTVLSSSATGECTQADSRQSVLFAVDTMTGCTLPGEVPASTCQSAIVTATELLVDQSMNASAYLASFGNLKGTDVGDWVPLLRTAVPTSSYCSGLTMTLEILYSQVGAVTNPQNRIIGSKLKFELDQSSSNFYASTNKFTLTSIVNFIDMTDTPSALTVGTPAHRYSERSDLDFFYPFVFALSSAPLRVVPSFSLPVILSLYPFFQLFLF